MRTSSLLAALLAFLLLAGSARAQSVQSLVSLGGSTDGQVESGRPAVIGILMPASAVGVGLSVKFEKGAGLDPAFSVVLPDGTVLDEAALAASGAALKISAKGVKAKGLPTPQTGLYKLVFTGRSGTAGGLLLKIKGKVAKPTPASGRLDGPGDFDDVALDLPERAFLSVSLAMEKGAVVLPKLELLTASGFSLDLTGFLKEKGGKISLKKFPVPYFGAHTLRVSSLGGSGGYTMKLSVKAGKPGSAGGSPSADAGPDLIAPPGTLVTLAGSVSPGSTQRWEQVSGPGVTLADPTETMSAFVAPEARGTHVFALVAFAGARASSSDHAVVEIDDPPIAVGGPSRRVDPGASVTLDGSESFDLDVGDELTFSWSQVSGTTVSLDDPAAAAPSFDAPASAGPLVFELVVSDGIADSVPDRVVVGVGPGMAVADAGRPVLVSPDSAVFLSGVRSTPLSGGVAGTFQWSLVDGPAGDVTLAGSDAPAASFTSPRTPESYRFRLTVDGNAATADEVLVVVSKSVTAGQPVAGAGGTTTVATGAGFTLTSSDPGGALTHEWVQTSGADAGLIGAGAVRNGTAPGSDDLLDFLLMVHDGFRYGPPDRATVVVGSRPRPTADAGADVSGDPGQTLTLNSSGSAAAAGASLVARTWTQLSGTDFYDVVSEDSGFDGSAAAPQIAVPVDLSSFSPARPLLFGLVVMDDLGGTSVVDTAVVTFTDLPPNASPTVMAAASAEQVRPGTNVSLSGVVNDRDGDDPALSWSLISGPTQVTIQNPTQSAASFVSPQNTGDYTFRLLADDGSGTPNATGSDTVTVTVNAAPSLGSVSVSPTFGPQGTPVTLSGNSVNDPEGDSLTFQWTELSPPGTPVSLTGAATATATFTMPAYSGTIASRTRRFRLRVTDLVGPVDVEVTFVPNQPPTLTSISANPQKIRYDNTASSLLSAGAATDPDGDLLTVEWTVTAGPTVSQSLLASPTGNNVSFKVPTPTAASPSRGGLYTISAVASDGFAQSGSAQTQVLAYPSWSNDVYPILSSRCASCHGTNGGLNMGTLATAYTNLRNVGSSGSAQLRVAPNNSAGSYVWNRVNSGQMPLGGPKLGQHLINMIRDWIEPDGIGGTSGLSAGAENN